MRKILTAILLVGTFCVANHYEHNYTRKMCEIIKVNNGCVTAQDECGFVWDFKGNGFDVGDIVDLKMHDSCTSSYIGDDVVREIVKR
jgi:hypothetical protein